MPVYGYSPRDLRELRQNGIDPHDLPAKPHSRRDEYEADLDVMDDDERRGIAIQLAGLSQANARILAELQSRGAAKARGDFYQK